MKKPEYQSRPFGCQCVIADLVFGYPTLAKKSCPNSFVSGAVLHFGGLVFLQLILNSLFNWFAVLMGKTKLKIVSVVAEPVCHVWEALNNRSQKGADKSGPHQSGGGIKRGNLGGKEFTMPVWSVNVAHGWSL